MIGEPRIYERPETPYMGIRIQTPFEGMFHHVDILLKEMNAWMKKQQLELAGPRFLRFHVIDMKGEMDIEVGFPVAIKVPDDGRVSSGVLPAGRYASLIFTGSGLAGNKALLGWAEANHLVWDKWEDPKGDAFRCRFEAYHTDPKVEHRKTKWEVEVAIKLVDEQPA